MLKLIIGKTVYSNLSVCTPTRQRRSAAEEERFFKQVYPIATKVLNLLHDVEISPGPPHAALPDESYVTLCGDFQKPISWSNLLGQTALNCDLCNKCYHTSCQLVSKASCKNMVINDLNVPTVTWM